MRPVRGVGSGRGSWGRSKTHCPQGHIYDESNTVRRKGARFCRVCHRDRNRLLRERGGEAFHARRRASHLACRYGLAPGEYDALLERQGGVCAICKRAPTSQKRTGRLWVDHDHETNDVRGLLCHRCNRAIGMFADDPSLLRVAADYLG